MKIYLPTNYYRQFSGDHTKPYPAESYGGWQKEMLPIETDTTAIVCMHAWDTGEDGEYPGWERCVDYIPRASKICREDMLPIISEGDAKLSAIKENISSYTSHLISAIMEYVDTAELKAGDKLELLSVARGIREAVYPDGDIFGGAYTHMMLLKDMAVLLMSLERPEEALDCLADCAKTANEFDNLPKVLPHTSPLVKGMRFSKTQLQIPQKHKKTPLRDIFMNEIMPLQCFDTVKYSPRITDICNIFARNEEE